MKAEFTKKQQAYIDRCGTAELKELAISEFRRMKKIKQSPEYKAFMKGNK